MELSPTGTEWNGFAYSNPDRNVYLWSCAGGESGDSTARRPEYHGEVRDFQLPVLTYTVIVLITVPL